MAKVPFSKLKCKINEDSVPVQFGEETIAVKQYLPIQSKLELISRVIELAHDQDYNYSNPVKLNVLSDLEIIFAYSNISFTDKQKEDIPKLYDLVASSGLLNTIIQAIPENEYYEIKNGIYSSTESVYKYQNSAMGVLDTINTDYDLSALNIQELRDNLVEGKGVEFLQEMLTKVN